ncbi:fatty-acyl-CoA synthase [Thiogranum longum]|uniref:Fatty-acyl-CoA synthase n=1 Tax=Thiogranum longum TaxID=1537524 RepID=A0A4R1HAT5_9GAMM|nr:fatty acyl-AMP ligase [Thiogranum longum]TCK19067.1 fatty-acyl-CoA synthase [Thiogranum longum]
MGAESTPTLHNLPFRAADFATLPEALDYAARGDTGANFYTGRGKLYATMPYAELREASRVLARKLLGMGLQKGDRVALVAETNPDFLRFFFACQYAGLIPVALPASVNLGGHTVYVTQLRGLLESSMASVAMAPEGYASFLEEAGEGLGLKLIGSPDVFDALPETDIDFPSIQPGDTAYIQYTSGSTRFPRGVVIKQGAVMSNLAGIIVHGVCIGPGDRCFSWLPFYHDMGLVGLVLVPVASQISVDYLDTREFAMRPRQWLNLMTQTKATISFGPPFGYELCTRRLRPGEAEKYDLSNWRVAGVGAEMIRSETLTRFAKALAPAGFDDRAFLACYGMAECSLAISFAPLFEKHSTDCVDGDHHSDHQEALPIHLSENPGRARCFVDCGQPLPEYEVEIRDEEGKVLSDRLSGSIFVRGPSVMSGYFNASEETEACLSDDGWLNTGDIGYRVNGNLIITGRKKDLIIINGRNIWPQDLEYLAEHQPEVRIGDALAFSVPGVGNDELCILVVQCRESDPVKRADLADRLNRLVHMELGIDVFVELVPLHTLPRTSSGKLSRSKARQNFIESHDISNLEAATSEPELKQGSV